MAGKFFSLEQAAEMLGKSADEIREMRQRGEIHGLRHGSSWRFKPEELERVAEDLGITLNAAAAPQEEGLLDVGDLGPTGSSELVLDLDAEETTESPTSVGKVTDDAEPSSGKEDSGLPLSSDSEISLTARESSDINLGSGTSDVFGGTDLGSKSSGLGSGDLVLEGSALGPASDLSLEAEEQPAASAEDDLTIGDEQAVSLAEDKESALEGGSDVTRGAGDTGINLRPSDSGLNLEEVPLDLAGSSVSSLELPEDDDIIALEELEASPDEATQLRADEDFQLAPGADLGQDEEDSGSQVIALEDSAAFAEAGAGAVTGLEDVGSLLPKTGESEEIDIQQEVRPVTQPRDFLLPAPEMAYSIWNVLSLLLIVLLLAVTGMLMTDVLRNMWSWEGNYSASTPIMDAMIRLLNMEP